MTENFMTKNLFIFYMNVKSVKTILKAQKMKTIMSSEYIIKVKLYFPSFQIPSPPSLILFSTILPLTHPFSL